MRDAQPKPTTNESIWVNADSCGKQNIVPLTAMKVTKNLFFRLKNFGDTRRPAIANRILEKPTSGLVATRYVRLAMRKAVIRSDTLILRKTSHTDRQFASRWKMFAWKKWYDTILASRHPSSARNDGHPKMRNASPSMTIMMYLIC